MCTCGDLLRIDQLRVRRTKGPLDGKKKKEVFIRITLKILVYLKSTRNSENSNVNFKTYMKTYT